MHDTANQLTLLTTLGIAAVKTFTMRTDKRVHVEGYGLAKTFRAHSIRTGEDSKWLRKLLDKSESFLVLGEPIDWPEGKKRRRLSEPDGEDAATLKDVPRSWMPVDVDHLNFKPMAPLSDGEFLALEVLDMLGANGARCVWHLTSSHGVEGKYRIRLWLSLEKPATCKAMKAYASKVWGELKAEVDGKLRACVDTSILRPAQPIYTGNPIFDGMDDPVEKRVGLIEGWRLKIKEVKDAPSKIESGDMNIERLKEAELYIKPASKQGHHMIVCPWEDEHSGEVKDNDTFYYEPNYEGREEPFLRCFHETCQTADRRWRDVELKMKWTRSFTKVGKTPKEKRDSDDVDEEEDFIYIHRFEQFWDPRDGAMISPKAYDSMHGHSGGRSKKGSPTERFLASGKTPKADSLAFLPGRGRIITQGNVETLNTYVDLRIAPDKDADVSIWTEHLEWLIPNEIEREHLCNWMASVYQNPDQKIGWAPILYGVPGTGKTTVFNCLGHCVGVQHMSEPTQSDLEDKYNEWAFGKLLVKIEELMSDNKYSVAEKLKPVVTNPTISVRSMYKAQFSARNFANVCASTNHIASLPIEQEDRRYMFVMCVEAKRKERVPHMHRFYEWLNKVGYGPIAGWLATRDLSAFKAQTEAPLSELKDAIADASMTEMQRAIDECDIFDDFNLITSVMLADYLEDAGMKIYKNKLGLIAIKRGWKSPGKSVRLLYGKNKISVWSGTKNMVSIKKLASLEHGKRKTFLDRLHAKSVFEELEKGKNGGIYPSFPRTPESIFSIDRNRKNDDENSENDD